MNGSTLLLIKFEKHFHSIQSLLMEDFHQFVLIMENFYSSSRKGKEAITCGREKKKKKTSVLSIIVSFVPPRILSIGRSSAPICPFSVDFTLFSFIFIVISYETRERWMTRKKLTNFGESEKRFCRWDWTIQPGKIAHLLRLDVSRSRLFSQSRWTWSDIGSIQSRFWG